MVSSESEHDICVVGSGIAGMLLAERLLAAGRSVLMAERGRALTFEDRRQQGHHNDSLPFNRTPHVSSPDLPGASKYAYHPVHGLGGSTNHFFGNMPRFHPRHFDAGRFGGLDRRWPIRYDEIEPYYLAAEARLAVSGHSERVPFAGRFAYPLPPHRLSPSDRACETIFGAGAVVPVPSVRPSQDVGGRPRCCGSNFCSLCPIDSKGTALNTVYPAIRDRVTLQSGLLATELHARRGRVESLTAVDSHGHARRLRARLFVIACNGVESCLLLQRSPTVPQHPMLGRCYMDHPSYQLAIYGTGLDTRPGYGDSAQTGMITAFFEQAGDGLPVSLLGEIVGQQLAAGQGDSIRDHILREVARRALERRHSTAPTFRGRFEEVWRSMLYLRFLVEMQPTPANALGIARIDPTGQAIPVVTLSLPPYMDACIDRVNTFIRRRLPEADVQHVMTGSGVQHWMGATRMADDRRDGCVDRHLRYRDLDNLYVLSASTFPSASSANPTLTLSALALRLGDHLTAS